MDKTTNPFLGEWRIVETELWDLADLDLVTRATISLKPNNAGSFAFIAIQAQLDYRVVARDGRPAIEFTFDGFDEGDEIMGRGWAVLEGERLRGHLFFHQGDDSSFEATRERPGRTNAPANIRLHPKPPRRSHPAHRRA